LSEAESSVDAKCPVPQLRLLGYMSGRPHIRLVHVPEAVVEPAPVPLNGSGEAFDFALRRDGWIAFGGFTVWGMPVPLEGEAFKVGRSFGFLRSENPRAIWVTDGHRSAEEGQAFLEYDGVARTVVDRVDVPRGYGMFDARGTDAFVRDRQDCEWLLDRRSGRLSPISYDDVPALLGERRLCGGREWVFIDDQGARTPVDPLPEGQPALSEFGSFSPDWRYFAVDLDVSDRSRVIPSMIDIAHGLVRYEPVPHRLVIIDCLNGAIAVAEGVFDDFASEFVWSLDSEWVVFSTPFAPHGIWACSMRDLRLEWISFGRRHAPGPLVNVSDLVPPLPLDAM
jgi:hypothetical protein